ncbi:hypothetical protein MtrunA17_Chr6g0480001 [Medicago truncatula]|uniref:Uncharacterized protein n=1 Tax=Medicago truncatula TaxID=3880 RepID=A0A396HIP2_MEDTR|nr:hypothetical protein MtrunA17_Chr6g0480001 [Medicago truncatula]
MSGLHRKHQNHHNDILVIPPRNPHEEIRVGEEITGVIDGIFSGGYLLTIRLGNGVTLQGSMLTSNQPSVIQGDVNVNVPLVPTNVNITQNVGNSEACIDLNTKKNTLEFEVDDDFSSDYSYLEISPLHEIQMCDLLLENFSLLCLDLLLHQEGCQLIKKNSSNKGKGVSIYLNSAPTRKGRRICRDPFLPRNFPSATVSIRPTYDLIAITS